MGNPEFTTDTINLYLFGFDACRDIVAWSYLDRPTNIKKLGGDIDSEP